MGIEMQELKVLRVLQPTEEALDARHEEKLVADVDIVVWYMAYPCPCETSFEFTLIFLTESLWPHQRCS